MKLAHKTKIDLEKQFQKVIATPVGFEFFVAIHDFVEQIEKNPTLCKRIANNAKMNRELNISAKYQNLKRIYQGFQDIKNESTGDLGHERYMTLHALHRIQKKEMSENNMLWKKRDLFRKLTHEIYTAIETQFAAPLKED